MKSDAVTDALKRNRDIPICAECAEKNGGVRPKGRLSTCNQDICSGCGMETNVCPMLDYEWPGRMREQREI